MIAAVITAASWRRKGVRGGGMFQGPEFPLLWRYLWDKVLEEEHLQPDPQLVSVSCPLLKLMELCN